MQMVMRMVIQVMSNHLDAFVIRNRRLHRTSWVGRVNRVTTAPRPVAVWDSRLSLVSRNRCARGIRTSDLRPSIRVERRPENLPKFRHNEIDAPDNADQPDVLGWAERARADQGRVRIWEATHHRIPPRFRPDSERTVMIHFFLNS